MKRRDKVIVVVFTISILALLYGCSKNGDISDIDIESLCNELLENAEINDELNAVDDIVIEKLYGVKTFEEAKLYISTGATAEEIAAFKFKNKETAEKGLEKARERIENQKADFETYIPKELKKLDNAFVKRFGKYVVICVSNGDEAEKIITKYFDK